VPHSESPAPAATGAGVLTGNAEWAEAVTGRRQFETAAERVRNVLRSRSTKSASAPAPTPPTSFIELFNASASSVDLSRWTIVHTPSQWAPVNLARISSGDQARAGGFYLLGASSSGLAAEASAGAITINVRSTVGLAAGQQIDVDGEHRTIVSVGTPAAAMTTLFVPVSTGPWITIPAGSTSCL